jgi:lysophospholipase L1-like esterase
MLMRHWVPELIALALLPILIAQGKYARRGTPRLPDATGPATGTAGAHHSGDRLSLLTVGESPVAGVGVETHQQAITGQLAEALADAWRRPVAWRACGRNGVTVRDALHQVVPGIPVQPVDVALVAFGVNDTTAFHSVARWRNDLRAILAAIEERCTPRLILLSGVPPVGHFPALPQPLRWVMGLKARTLDCATKDLALSLPRVRYAALSLDPTDATLMASDGYHPSAIGCAMWATLLAGHCKHEGRPQAPP